MDNIFDEYFAIKVVNKTLKPNKTVYAALHQDYSETFVMEQAITPTERRCGYLLRERLLKGGRGHFGPLEHVTITLGCGYFPHSTVQQLTRQRIASFDVQSNRYTGARIIEAAQGRLPIESVFYVRPAGIYSDRKGNKYHYTDMGRKQDLLRCLEAAKYYVKQIAKGMSEEHARALIPFDVRQHFVLTVNARSLMHFLDLRAKADAQLECQIWCKMVMPHFRDWMPELAEWYVDNRWGKAKLSP